MSSTAGLREAGIPGEAVRAYPDELGLPRHDVHLDLARLRRLATEALAAMPDLDLARRIDVPRGSARDPRRLRPRGGPRVRRCSPRRAAPVRSASPETIERFRELRERANGRVNPDGATVLLRELKAVRGDLKALRLALTGRDRGPELWTSVVALSRDEALRRVEACL
jgi:hypothetical protein